MNNLITESRHIPVNEATQTISISPVMLETPERARPLELRITAPVNGRDLPIVLLAHGHGPSLYIPSKDGYGPLVNFYAEHGFVVIQPSLANSKVAGLDPESRGGPMFWRERVEEMRLVVDSLMEIEALVPAISGRLDHEKIAAVGHSLGGQTVAMLLGARLTDPKDENARDVNLIEPRIKVGVLLAAPGNGGDDLSEYAAENLSAMNPDFSHMTTQALVVVGDSDVSPHLTVRGPDWHADAYHDGPGAEALLTLVGGKHGLGGISGYDAKEADDEDPDRLAVTLRITWAYLRSALHDGDKAWSDACATLEDRARAWGRVALKPVRPSRKQTADSPSGH